MTSETQVRRCEICGNDPSEHNWEAHAAEMRAESYAYWEPQDDDRDYTPDEPVDDAKCFRCGEVGIQWNVDVKQDDGSWEPVCTDCERPEDWTTEDEAKALWMDGAERRQMSMGI